MLACDWNGHSYSASIDARRGLECLVDVAAGLPSLALAHRRLADVVVERGLSRGTAASASDHSTFSFSARRIASHSLSATTARKSFSQTTLAPGMSLIELSSTLTGTAPATGGRIMRACTMPGTFTSVTKSSWQNTFGATSSRLIGLPTILYSLGFFGCALPGA